mmetsp:Transcript_35713/g.50623  ORF Transcript_35713/g.50623 Transcript_35713/m.50623 type:complete len:95 (+) Transcript_35713:1571-1855(+)
MDYDKTSGEGVGRSSAFLPAMDVLNERRSGKEGIYVTNKTMFLSVLYPRKKHKCALPGLETPGLVLSYRFEYLYCIATKHNTHHIDNYISQPTK